MADQMGEGIAESLSDVSPITEEVKAEMRALLARYPLVRSAMLPCLHLVQQAQGRITVDGVLAVAEVLGVKPDEVESIVTFYSMFSNEPRGRHVLKVCTSIACYLRGCDALLDRLESRLGVARGETTPDGRFTLETIECLAACGGAPVVQVNGEFVELVTPERADELVDRLVRDEGIADLAARWRETDNGGFIAASGTTPVATTAGSTTQGGLAAEVRGNAMGETTGAATGIRLEIAPTEGGSSANGAAANSTAGTGTNTSNNKGKSE